MQKAVAESKVKLLGCIANYTRKANAREPGGVGFETIISSHEYSMTTSEERARLIPVVRDNDLPKGRKLPNYLGGCTVHRHGGRELACKTDDGPSQRDPVPSQEMIGHNAPANFTLKLLRPGSGPAAELPASSPAGRRHGGCSSPVAACNSSPATTAPLRLRHVGPVAQLSVRSVSRTRGPLLAVSQAKEPGRIVSAFTKELGKTGVGIHQCCER